MAQPFQPGQRVRMNLSGMMYKGVGFHAAVTDALGQLVRKTSEDPPVWLVKFVFQFKGLEEIEVSEDRVPARMTRWDERYGKGEHIGDQPSALVIAAAERMPPGDALDLACGLGRNAIYLARLGWRVTAVDSSALALELLRERAAAAGASVDTRLADLEEGGFVIAPEAYDLVCVIRYLQRDLFPRVREAVRPGGLVAAEVLIEGPHNPAYMAAPGELRGCFTGWEVLAYAEGQTATILARRPPAETL